MRAELGVRQLFMASSAPVVWEDLVFVGTSNGRDSADEKVIAPNAPSFLAVNKDTGKVVWQDNSPGEGILHGQWSSPALGLVNGVQHVVFAGGDGWLYGFSARSGEKLWRFDLNPKDAVWPKTRNYGVSTPVFSGGRVFMATGQDPDHPNGAGHAYSINPELRGDITESGRVWRYDKIRRSISTAAVADGLVYLADFNGIVHCLDAGTGQPRWTFDMLAPAWGSPLVADGKVYVGDQDGDVAVLKAGTELKKIAEIDMADSVYSTPGSGERRALRHDALAPLRHRRSGSGEAMTCVAHRAAALVLGLSLAFAPGQPSPSRPDGWDRFRGSPALLGVAGTALATPLKLAWTFQAKDAIGSSAAIADGTVYVGSSDGLLHAIDLATGKARWQYSTNSSIEESSPAVREGVVYVGDMDGVVHAVDAATGKARWTFKTDGEIQSSPNWSGDRLFIGSYDEHLYCLSATSGALLWKFRAGGPVHCTPAVDHDTVYVAGCDEHLRGIDVATGQQRLEVPLGNYTGASAAVTGGEAYVGTFGNEVLGIALARPAVRWRYYTTRTFPFHSSAAVAGDRVVLGGRDKLVHCVARSTGRALWTFRTRARVDSSPLIAGGRVFVGSSDGNLYELDLATGKQAWQFTAGGALTASPAAAGGSLVIGSQDGALYCLR